MESSQINIEYTPRKENTATILYDNLKPCAFTSFVLRPQALGPKHPSPTSNIYPFRIKYTPHVDLVKKYQFSRRFSIKRISKKKLETFKSSRPFRVFFFFSSESSLYYFRNIRRIFGRAWTQLYTTKKKQLVYDDKNLFIISSSTSFLDGSFFQSEKIAGSFPLSFHFAAFIEHHRGLFLPDAFIYLLFFVKLLFFAKYLKRIIIHYWLYTAFSVGTWGIVRENFALKSVSFRVGLLNRKKNEYKKCFWFANSNICICTCISLVFNFRHRVICFSYFYFKMEKSPSTYFHVCIRDVSIPLLLIGERKSKCTYMK